MPNKSAFFVLSFLPSGPHHFREGNFLIATLSKPRLQGAELRLQQHFRWVTFRWDQEPLHSLLGRHLRKKLLHKVRQRFSCSCQRDCIILVDGQISFVLITTEIFFFFSTCNPKQAQMLGNGSLRVAQGDVIKNIVELFTGNPVCDIPSHMSF